MEFGPRTPKKHAVVIGAGFGGLACAKKLRKSPSYSVTLIDRNPYQLFSPLLYQVSTASLPEDDIAFPVRTAYRDVQFVRAEVTNIDATKKESALSNGKTISYDDLILAAVIAQTKQFKRKAVTDTPLNAEAINQRLFGVASRRDSSRSSRQKYLFGCDRLIGMRDAEQAMSAKRVNPGTATMDAFQQPLCDDQ